MKASYRNGKGAARHNDRTNIHYDKEREKMNKIYVSNSKGELIQINNPKEDFLQKYELKGYEFYYKKWLEKRNEKEQKNGHSDRIKTMQEIYKSKRYEPQETIYQIGSKEKGDDLQNIEQFTKILLQQIKREQEKFPNIKILSIAIHCDEGAIHAHVRKCFVTRGEPGMKKAFDEMQIERPKPYEKENRFNNQKITYSNETREIWYEEIENELGIKIDRSVETPSRKRKEKLEHEIDVLGAKFEDEKEIIKQVEELQQIRNSIQENINNDNLETKAALIDEFMVENGYYMQYLEWESRKMDELMKRDFANKFDDIER